jgi:hypothetical protein
VAEERCGGAIVDEESDESSKITLSVILLNGLDTLVARVSAQHSRHEVCTRQVGWGRKERRA